MTDRPRVEWRHAKALDLTNVNREALPLGYTKLLSLSLSAAYLVPLGGR